MLGHRGRDKSDNRWFWNRYARLYDFEIARTSKAAYAEMYRRMSATLTKDMDVLEVATGTGLIALNIASSVHSIVATDFSPKMIETANKKSKPQNLVFQNEDATALSFADNSFDAVIISNALHIMPEPQKALFEISRVLKNNGFLIAPNFTHGHLKKSTWNLSASILKRIGFETYQKWTPEEYVSFVGTNGFDVDNWSVMRAAFPLVYLEARKRGKSYVSDEYNKLY
ncbi:MAG: class I SAM-dependent methyltransferase [Clostridiales Family XIII bacterium]|jgi:ubiquinone/menaquinone biosynthesis C-methylase UbiE|nr:class I SAM-dependent methyltransferase [Clostridiales Family XIII bacterium]